MKIIIRLSIAFLPAIALLVACAPAKPAQQFTLCTAFLPVTDNCG